ncbi:MAG: type VI secretion system tube protein Hcp [Candidatus Heimdallarchaeota archaeon]
MDYRKFNRKAAIACLVVITASAIAVIMIGVQSAPSAPKELAQSTSDYMVMRVYSTDGKILGEALRPEAGDIELYQYEHTTYHTINYIPGAGASSVTHTPVTVVKLWDKASVNLTRLFMRGAYIPSVQILFYRAGAIDTLYYNVTLMNVRIVSILISSDVDTTFEMVSFDYQSIYWIDELHNIWYGIDRNGIELSPPL